MRKLYLEQVNTLLGLIRNAEDRKAVKKFLDEIMNVEMASERSKLLKRRSAKNALNVLWRIGIEIGKHKLLSDFLDLFD